MKRVKSREMKDLLTSITQRVLDYEVRTYLAPKSVDLLLAAKLPHSDYNQCMCCCKHSYKPQTSTRALLLTGGAGSIYSSHCRA